MTVAVITDDSGTEVGLIPADAANASDRIHELARRCGGRVNIRLEERPDFIDLLSPATGGKV